MDPTQIKEFCSELIENAPVVYLSTLDYQGLPQTRAMLNLHNKKLYPDLSDQFLPARQNFRIYFSTNTSSQKVAQMRNNPAGCVYYCMPELWRGFMLQGQIEFITDRILKEQIWQPGWEMYYPGGTTDSDYTVFCLNPVTGIGYQNLQNFTINF